MKWRKIKYILFHRSVLAGLALVAQVAVLFVMVNEFTAHFDYFYWFCIFVSFLATVWIVSDRSEPGYKIAWLVVILPFPVFGVRKEARNERLNQRVTRGFAPSFSRDGGFAFGRSCPYRR